MRGSSSVNLGRIKLSFGKCLLERWILWLWRTWIFLSLGIDHMESLDKLYEKLIKNRKGNFPQMELPCKLRVRALG
jgi:hypothetical protein